MGRKTYSPYQKELQKRIAENCYKLRLELGYTLLAVAEECRTSPQDICAFEHARNNSATIFYWYIKRGVKID